MAHFKRRKYRSYRRNKRLDKRATQKRLRNGRVDGNAPYGRKHHPVYSRRKELNDGKAQLAWESNQDDTQGD